MLVDDQTQTQGTETPTEATTDGAAAEVKESPSFDWEAVKSHPEFKTHAQSVYEANEEIRKEAVRGVRKTDIESRANERAKEIAADDRKRADALQARLDAAELAREQALLSTMTDDEQERHKLQRRAEAAEAKVNRFETAVNSYENDQARDDIIAYAQTNWGLDDEGAAALRESPDSIDLMDKAFKAVTRQRAREQAELKDLRTKNTAQGRVLSGESTFAATGNAGAGGEMSDDEVADLYRTTGTSSPNYERVRKAYEKVYRRRGY